MDPKRIRAAREALGMRQRELAEVAGISPSQMSRVEAGKRWLRQDQAERIANKLGMIIDTQEGLSQAKKECCKRASFPLPEGMAIVEYPDGLSPESRKELQQWLELIGRMVARWL